MMRAFFILATIVIGLANSGLAYAQSASGGMVHSPSLDVDSGINANGSARQQSPAADINGKPMNLVPQSQPAVKPQPQSNTPGSIDNALTNSPKGPGTGGNDATK